jgi:hypothetical protein
MLALDQMVAMTASRPSHDSPIGVHGYRSRLSARHPLGWWADLCYLSVFRFA